MMASLDVGILRWTQTLRVHAQSCCLSDVFCRSLGFGHQHQARPSFDACISRKNQIKKKYDDTNSLLMK